MSARACLRSVSRVASSARMTSSLSRAGACVLPASPTRRAAMASRRTAALRRDAAVRTTLAATATSLLDSFGPDLLAFGEEEDDGTCVVRLAPRLRYRVAPLCAPRAPICAHHTSSATDS